MKQRNVYVARCGHHCGNLYFSTMAKGIAGVYAQAKLTGTEIARHSHTHRQAIFFDSNNNRLFDAGVWKEPINAFDEVINNLNFLN
jgi:hypothetical protein